MKRRVFYCNHEMVHRYDYDAGAYRTFFRGLVFCGGKLFQRGHLLHPTEVAAWNDARDMCDAAQKEEDAACGKHFL